MAERLAPIFREFASRIRNKSKGGKTSCEIAIADLAEACALSLYVKKTTECWRITKAGESQMARAMLGELKRCYPPSRLTELVTKRALVLEFISGPSHDTPCCLRLTVNTALIKAA